MNNALVTTGLQPLCVNSTETFQFQGMLDGLPWDLTSGSATLKLTDPNGNNSSITATISGGCAFANWTVVGPAGNWLRAWDIVDATGIRQVSRPIIFAVISSPS